MKEIINDCGRFLVDANGVLLAFECDEKNIFQPLARPYERDEKYVNWLAIPEGVTVLPKGAFDGYRVFMDITFPQSLRSIGDESGGALRFCSFRKVELPEKLAFLAQDSFFGSYINEINLPDGMEPRMLQECIYRFESLTSHFYLFYPVERVRDLPALRHRTRELKNESGRFFVNDCGALLRFLCAPENNAANCPAEKTKDVYNLRIPEGVTMLPSCAFEYYTVRKQLTLPRSLVILGTGNGCAFQGSTLPEVHISGELRHLGTFAFGTSHIRELWLPQNPGWGYARQFKGAHIGTVHFPAGPKNTLYEQLCDSCTNNVCIGTVIRRTL